LDLHHFGKAAKQKEESVSDLIKLEFDIEEQERPSILIKKK
jgi:hypothetical protein